MSDVEDTLIVPKIEQSGDGSLSSSGSSPDPGLDGIAPLAENVQVQKRKGGRKPIYATSEERKQRNRQAQAAFRERRTEYIKQLETTIKQQDDQLQTLQQSHRSAADECLMLRYKNSLLERILLEKGIDVQAELKSKDMPPGGRLAGQPKPMQRAVISRHHQARRSISGSGSRLLQGAKGNAVLLPNHSPRLQPLSPSHTSSPTSAGSPIFAVQGMNSPSYRAQQQSPLRANTFPVLSNPAPGPHGLEGRQLGDELQGAVQTRHGPWPSPYQTHIEQLEQEYQSHADMLDDQDPADQPVGPGPYPQPFQHLYPPGQPPMMHPPHPVMQGRSSMQLIDPDSAADGMNQMFDPFDPMLDADPFGLTASMHFPTQFTFQESAMRK